MLIPINIVDDYEQQCDLVVRLSSVQGHMWIQETAKVLFCFKADETSVFWNKTWKIMTHFKSQEAIWNQDSASKHWILDLFWTIKAYKPNM